MSIIKPGDVILCGMVSERQRLQRALPNNPVLMGQDKLNLNMLVPRNTTRIISMGLFGGLAFPIGVGDVVLATTLDSESEWICDPKWNDAVFKMASGVSPESPGPQDPLPMMWNSALRAVPWFSTGVVGLADTVTQRAVLYNDTGAFAIDDESYYAAVFCKTFGIPFNIMRACSDDASETLPLAARSAVLNASGAPDMAAFLAALGGESLLDDLDLIKIGADYYNALDMLQQAAEALAA
jgi:hypothetical protein